MHEVAQATGGLPASLADAVPLKAVGIEAEPENPDRGSAPANDACANAEQIFGTGTFEFDTTNATTDGLAHFACNFFGQAQIARDVWFRWTAPASANFRVETCNLTTLDTKLAVYNGGAACPPTDAALIVCNDDACGPQSRVQFEAVAGNQYLIRAGMFPGLPGGTGSIRIVLSPGQDVCQLGSSSCQGPDPLTAYEATGMTPFDDFRPSQSGQITTVCFRGAYYDGVGTCEGAAGDRFVIEYYLSQSGFPAFTPFASFEQPGSLQVLGPIPTGQVIAGLFPVMEYRATHFPVNVSAGTCYWISIRNLLEGGCAWYLQSGTGGNSVAIHAPFSPSQSTFIADDFAWCIGIPLDSPVACNSGAPPSNDECAGARELFCNSIDSFRNTFATENLTDPHFSCRGGTPGPGLGTVWFRFQATATDARISLCHPENVGDTLLAVYSGTCGDLTEIACNDDFCGRRSQVFATGLVPGQYYYVQAAAYDQFSKDFYRVEIDCPIPPPPANDICGGAFNIEVGPGGLGFVTQSTKNALIDSQVPSCDFNPIVAPTIWYKVTGTGEVMRASLCSSVFPFDTKMSVFCGECDGLVCVAQNDDACGVHAVVEWCSEVGRTYYIMIHGFNGSIGTAEMFVTSDGLACGDPPDCSTCTVGCPPGAVLESELCGESSNGGCNSPGLEFGVLSCGQTVCGTAFAGVGVRDTDWYEFTLSTPSRVTWSVEADLDVEILILDGNCFPSITILAEDVIGRCGPGSVTADLPAGVFRLFIANANDGQPCGSFNDYTATLTCVPLGACCIGSECLFITESECDALEGVFAGGGVPCPIVYEASQCANALEDISQTGTDLLLGNEDGLKVEIGFPFRFFGQMETTIGVLSEGYLMFGELVGEPFNEPIPSPTPPNALIAPMWTNLSPGVTGGVFVQTKGTEPNRRFIAQWHTVPRFQQADANTFQAVLFEGSNCIEFRYGTITPAASASSYTVGVEDAAGASGTSIDPLTLAPGVCIRLCPTVQAGDCDAPEPGGCVGDANSDGVVDFNDIVSILANWQTSGPLGDGNNDGVVNFNDIVSVLANWGCQDSAPCPGDANGDRLVDFNDIVSVLANWLTSGPGGDANRDGVVDFNDITTILANWLASCP